jgi:hypothetical protein
MQKYTGIEAICCCYFENTATGVMFIHAEAMSETICEHNRYDVGACLDNPKVLFQYRLL